VLAPSNWVERACAIATPQFAVHKGLMLSGEKLLDNPEELKKLYAKYPKAIGGDMEATGLVAACHTTKIDWLVIKGVSDWGDGSKSSIGEEQKTQDQLLAARHAAQVAYTTVFLVSLPTSFETSKKSGRTATQPGNKKAKEHPITQLQSKPPAGTVPNNEIQAKTPDLAGLKVLLDNYAHSNTFARQHGEQHQQRETAPAQTQNLNAHQALLHWLQNAEAPPVFALLGEYGMGKTITCQRLYHELQTLRTHPPTPAWAREPLYFDLRALSLFKNKERSGTVSLPTKQELITDLIAHGWEIDTQLSAPGYAEVHKSLQQGALLILDGLDECLVHLVDAQHSMFVRSLVELLTDADKDGKAGTRLLLSCRTNFFKTFADQRSLFTGQQAGKVDAAWYQALQLLPFTPTQIQDYLAHVIPDVPIDRAMDLLANTHNLTELAQRPMTLKLISEQISSLELLRQQGTHIDAATLYSQVAKDWLHRDDGKHHLEPEHKMRLMPALAAHLWCQGARSLPYDALHIWFHQWRASQPDLRERYAPQAYNQNKLEEDLRTASFMVRQDGDAQHNEGFRFAHSSLQEFFLAQHLANAVQANRAQDWAMPLPSPETLGFLADILVNQQADLVRGGKGADHLGQLLNQWRKTYLPQASELLLKFALLAQERNTAQPPHSGTRPATPGPQVPAPLLAGFNLAGAQLRGWRFGTPYSGSALPLLAMQSCDFTAADLRDTYFDQVRLDDAQLGSARLDGAALQHCSLLRGQWAHASLVGTALRHVALQGSSGLASARSYRSQWVACTGIEQTVPGAMPAYRPAAPPSTAQLAWLTGHSDTVW
ncbi:MAG: NACHT domain-containing protein, partial [Burkholderiaceae bacterium]